MITYIAFIFLLFYIMLLEKIILNIKKKRELNHGSHAVLIKEGNKKHYKKANVFIILALIIIFLFSAFRFNVGWDYSAYYNTIEYGVRTNIMNNEEFATIFLVELAKKIEFTNLYFFINSLITLAMLFITIKKYSTDYWLSIIMFVCFPLFYLNSFSVIRTFTALGITFGAFEFIVEKKPMKYAACILIATLFHKSSVIAISLYFLQFIKIRTRHIGVFFALMPLLRGFVNYLILTYFPQYAFYTQETEIQEGTRAIFIFLLIGVVSLIFRKAIVKNDDSADIYLNIFYFGLAIYLMFFDQGTMGHRLSLYGTIYSLLLVPKIVSVFDNRTKLILRCIIYFGLLVMFLLTIQNGELTYIPYRTIFNNE